MKTLMTTTALVASITFSGAAAAQTADAPLFRDSPQATDIHASEFIGMRVYAADPATDDGARTMTETAGRNVDWDDVGEINDLVVTREGDVASVLVDIGGFLGIGERQIAMDMANIRFVSDTDTDDADDFFLVIPAARADFEEAPEYREDPEEMVAAMDDVDHDAMNVGTMGDPMTMEETAMLTTEDLTGARVYDAEGEWIGEVSELLLMDTGEIGAAIVDVGGFLGIGEKPVELSMDQLQIRRTEDGDAFTVSVPMTEEELEQLPTWDS